MPEDRKAARAAEARRHIATMNVVFAEQTKASATAATVYKEGAGRSLDVPAPRFEATRAQTLRIDAVEAVMGIAGEHPAVLDFASFTNPGGGYDRGAWAQEEALCAGSNLFSVLEACKPFYEGNRSMWRGGLFTDKCMYVPDVMFGEGNAIRPAGVVVCAAPNRRRALENGRDEVEVDHDLARRVECVMRVAAAQGVDGLVLGAFGCGVFGNDATRVAGLFKEWLDAHPGVFENVVFAVPGGPNAAAFEEAFPRIVEAEPQDRDAQADPGEDEEDGTDDWRAYMTAGAADGEDGAAADDTDDTGAGGSSPTEEWRRKLASFKK